LLGVRRGGLEQEKQRTKGNPKVKIRTALLVLVVSVSACATQSSVLVSGAQPAQKVAKTQRSFLWGIIASDKSWDPRTQCPNGVSKVDVSQFIDFVGVYSSYKLEAWCSAGLAAGQPGGNGSVIIVR
jgi:hypothetical protein